MNLRQLIKRQKLAHEGRHKRANVVLKTVGNLSKVKVDKAAVKGYKHLLTLEKDQIIEKYIDGLDIVMLGLIGEDK